VNVTVGWIAPRWVSPMIYGVVLAAGLYYGVRGLGGDHVPAVRVASFAAVMGLLFALEAAQGRWRAPGASRWAVAALLVARLGLFVAAAALDPSGESRVLFVLVPFAAYFAFGRAVSLVLATVCLALLVAGFMLRVPHWYTQAAYLSDVLMFAVGLVLAIAMASVAVAEQAYAAQVASLSAEAERTRLARDIHDSLGHHLTAIAVQLEKAQAFRGRDPDAADQALADARASVRQALGDVRLSVRALRGGAGPAALPAMLTELVREADAGQPQVTLSVTGDDALLSPAASTVLYRGAQEALTNARRHSGARKVSVSLALGDREARLVVADDGRGFGPGCPPGFGLLGIRERAALAGGRADIVSTTGAGTTVTVTVPRQAPARVGGR
jgi:signal transduction histidine kinase